ncbi:MAG: aminotransferase class IV [Proteobacteria bacterium]|jgi:D-alanine transaminase|nr:aminotransferase class IV [Pseudomonadota bacterium]
MSVGAGRICYLNGDYLPLGEARVSVLDRGFIFGDAVYEVIIASGGRIFALEEHLERLTNSLNAILLDNPLGAREWQTVLQRLVDDNGGGEQSLYVQVTRGVAERDHAFPRGVAPTVFAMSRPLSISGGLAEVEAVVLPDNRWQRCDIKSTSLLPNVLLRNQAIAAGAYEAVLVRDGFVTEGSASNVFVVHGGCVRTAPLSAQILPGVSRALLIDVLRGNDITVEEVAVPVAALADADEVWLTSTTRDLVAVTRIDGVTVGKGEYPLAARAYREFQLYKAFRLR